MDPARLQRRQQRRLSRLLSHAADRSAFYRDRFHGVDLSRCPLADLPVTNKTELMADFDRAVTDLRVRRAEVECFVDDPANSGRLLLGRYHVCHTSGSQGQPLLIVQNTLVLDLLFALQLTRGNGTFRLGPLEPFRRLLNPGRLAVLASVRGFYPSASAWQHAPAVLWRACQQHQLVLLTGNRNKDGPDSLEATIQAENTPQSLPVFTLADPLSSGAYAEPVAIRLLEHLYDIGSLRGTGRMYIP